MDKFWQFIRNEGAAEGEPQADLLLYGEIASSEWWGDEVTPAAFANELKGLGDVNHIRVRINSPGGDVFAGQTMYSLLKSHPAKVTTMVDGLAASAASVVLMAGDEVIMPENAMMMIHNPWTIAMGDARDMRATADVLDQVRETIIAAYQAKSGQDRGAIINQLNSETWMTASQAKELGYIDTVASLVPVSAKGGTTYMINNLVMDMAKFKVWPGATLNSASSEALADDPVDPVDPVESPVEAATREERQRIAAIEKLSIGLSGVDALKQRALFDEPMTPAQYSQALVESGLLARNQQLDARRNGAAAANVRPASAESTTNATAAQRSVTAQMIADAAMKQRGANS